MLTLLSFLSGTAFRLIFGGVMDYLNKRQDHLNEMARLEQQEKFDAARHERQQALIRLQSDLKLGEIKLVGEVAVSQAEANAFVEAVKATGRKVGVKWVDAWNAVIRPAGATVSLTIWVGSVVMAYWTADWASIKAGLVLTEFDKTLIAAFLGVFIGERIHNSLRK